MPLITLHAYCLCKHYGHGGRILFVPAYTASVEGRVRNSVSRRHGGRVQGSEVAYTAAVYKLLVTANTATIYTRFQASPYGHRVPVSKPMYTAVIWKLLKTHSRTCRPEGLIGLITFVVILQIKVPNSCDVVRVTGVGSCNGHE